MDFNMKYYFPPQNQTFRYLQTNRSDRLGSIWSSFNLDFIKKLGTLKLAKKLVINTSTVDDANLGLPIAFEFFYNKWWAICGGRMYKQTSANGDLITKFSEDTSAFGVGDSTSRFDITNPAGTTFRYTYDGTGTNPNISATSFPIGGVAAVYNTNMAGGNEGTFAITGSGANYFEVTNAGGSVESDKTIGTGLIVVSGGTEGQDFSPNYSDLAIYNDCIWATGTNALYKKTKDIDLTDAGAWFRKDTLSTSIHKMLYFKKHDLLYYMSGSTMIRSVDVNDTINSSGNYTIDMGKSVGWNRTMVGTSQYIWIGTIRFNDATDSAYNNVSGAISQWDGFSTQVLNEFPLTTSGVLGMCVLDDIPYAIDTSGRILQYTGYSFKEISRLPLGDKMLLSVNDNNATYGYPVHYNGMIATDNNTIQILVNNKNGDSVGSINENLPSGIWELDLTTNSLTHKQAPTLKTKDEATVRDYGQNRVLAVGALKKNMYESASASGKSETIAGISYFTDATTSKSGIFIDSPVNATTDLEGQKRGYFVTTWYESTEIADIWERLWTTYKQFINATDKIVFKYRLLEEDPTYTNITWVNTNSFTTTTDVLAYVGYEVEILQGVGSGACPQIVSVTNNAGTYTVVIDHDILGVTVTTAKARFQKWMKLAEVSGTIMNYKEIPIMDKRSTQIQIKGVLEWTGDSEFNKMIINSKSYITTSQ